MKQIIITGKHNITKITGEKQKREIIQSNTNIEDKYFYHNNQIKLLNELYMTDFCHLDYFIKREIKNKINSYKSQDKKKECFDEYYFISLERVIELLVESKLMCYYCKTPIKILYEYIQQPTQWTLDRIDNDQGHNMDNCVISCLKCNIQRKTMNDKKFKFTKQMKLIKLNT